MPERGRPTQAGISVQDICYALPEQVVTNQALSAENPGWDMEAVDDISLFVFHQASKVILESLARLLGLPQEKVYCNLQWVGNAVSASIPMALRGAWDEGRLARASCFQASASASRGPAHWWSSSEGAACSRHSYNSS